jgi:hypothetical protein
VEIVVGRGSAVLTAANGSLPVRRRTRCRFMALFSSVVVVGRRESVSDVRAVPDEAKLALPGPSSGDGIQRSAETILFL